MCGLRGLGWDGGMRDGGREREGGGGGVPVGLITSLFSVSVVLSSVI